MQPDVGRRASSAAATFPAAARANWPLGRLLMSRLACLLARRLTPVRDATSGFFLIRRDLARGVRISAGGFKICLELLVRGRPASVVEVPYVFVGRTAGESKMNMREALGYLDAAARPAAVRSGPAEAARRPTARFRRRSCARSADASRGLRPVTQRSRRDAADVSTTRAPNIVRDSTCQTMLCLVSASCSDVAGVPRDVAGRRKKRRLARLIASITICSSRPLPRSR